MQSMEKINNVCLVILAGIGLTGALIYTRTILVPFVFALFGYAVMFPILKVFCERLKIPRWLSIFIVLILFFGFLGAVVYFFASSVGGFMKSADQYRSTIIQFVTWLAEIAKQYGFSIESDKLREALREVPVLSYARSFTGNVLGWLGNSTLVFVFLMFLLMGDSPSGSSANPLLEEIRLKISRYVATKLFTSVTTGLLVGALLGILNVEMATMFAIATVLLNFIPSFGSVLAVLLPIPVLLLQFGFSWPLYVALGLSGGIQFTIGNILEPKLMGESLDLHPITLLLFLMFWGLVWGVAGMFLAVPITAILKIALSRIETTKPLAKLLSGHLPTSV